MGEKACFYIQKLILTKKYLWFKKVPLAVSTCKCTARKVKEYFRKNTQKGYENLIFLLGDGLFCQQFWSQTDD